MKEIDITIKTNEVLHDIGMNVYTIGERMTDKDAKHVFVAQSALDENNRNLVIREINKAWQSVLYLLTAYRTKRSREIEPIKPKPDNIPVDKQSNELSEKDFEMSLYFPDNPAHSRDYG